MKSFFAPALSSLCILFTCSVQAKTYTGRDALKAEFSAQDAQAFANATVNLNYAAKELAITLQPVMTDSAPVSYTLHEARSTVDRCGIITTTALIDNMPVDGIRLQVTLHNNRGNSCDTQKPLADLHVQKKFYDRLQGKLIVLEDSFLADSLSLPYAAVIRANLDVVSSERYESANLYLDGRRNLISISFQAAGEEAVSYELNNAMTTVDSCGIIRTVASFDHRPFDGIFMKVSVNNNRNNTCPTFAPLAALDVLVDQSYVSRVEGGEVNHFDVFKAEDFAVIKPRN